MLDVATQRSATPPGHHDVEGEEDEGKGIGILVVETRSGADIG
jgi:hypothetical protein